MGSTPRNQTWSVSDIPNQVGRVVVITGANTGTGFAAAEVLAARGASVILACRNDKKAQAAAQAIREAHCDAAIETLSLDLGSLDSIRAAAESIQSRHSRVDLLLNNAGVMVPPAGKTADGFEIQFGTNHLGHFAFTGLLFELLRSTPGARIVTMSSNTHKMGWMRFEDLHFASGYKPWPAYGQSKLANLLFAYELQNRLEKAGDSTLSIASHPGWAKTELQRNSFQSGPGKLFVGLLERFLAHDAHHGALPMLRAALDPAVRGGDYYGPGGFMEMVGQPVKVNSSDRSHDAADQQRLWQLSEQLTGVRFPV